MGTVSSQFVQPDFTVSCKFVDDILGKKPAKTFSGAYYHKVSGDMQVGAEIAKVSTSPDVDLAFGCLYKLDKDTAIKGKVLGRQAVRQPQAEALAAHADH